MTKIRRVGGHTPHSSQILRRCKACGERLVVERWLPLAPQVRARAHASGADVGVQIVDGAPAWATQFAVQGVDSVSRYRCPTCRRVGAILAHDFG